MSEDIVKESIKCLANMEIKETTYQVARSVVLDEIERLNNIINELEKDIKNLYTYGIKNNAEQRDYLLNKLESLKELKGSD